MMTFRTCSTMLTFLKRKTRIDEKVQGFLHFLMCKRRREKE